MIRTHKPPPDAVYRQAYDCGWRYAKRMTASLQHGLDTNQPDGWFEGFLDEDQGFEKWHSFYCRLAGGCSQHPQ